MKNETAPPFVHCELTAIINLKSKQDLSLIIHWIDIVGKLSFLNEKVKVLMKKQMMKGPNESESVLRCIA